MHRDCEIVYASLAQVTRGATGSWLQRRVVSWTTTYEADGPVAPTLQYEEFPWEPFPLDHDDVIKGNIFRVTGHLCGEFTGHRSPVNSPHKGQWRGALMFSLSYLNKRLSKQWWGWWFKTPLCSLWRHCNGGNVVAQTEQAVILSRTLQFELPRFTMDITWRHGMETLYAIPALSEGNPPVDCPITEAVMWTVYVFFIVSFTMN